MSSGPQKLGAGLREASSNTIPHVFSFLNFHLLRISVMLSHNLSH